MYSRIDGLIVSNPDFCRAHEGYGLQIRNNSRRYRGLINAVFKVTMPFKAFLWSE